MRADWNLHADFMIGGFDLSPAGFEAQRTLATAS